MAVGKSSALKAAETKAAKAAKAAETKAAKAAETKAAKAAEPKKKVAKKKVAKKFCSVHVAMHHPFQRILIPTNPPGVYLDRDSWLDSQIGAGLVKEL